MFSLKFLFCLICILIFSTSYRQFMSQLTGSTAGNLPPPL